MSSTIDKKIKSLIDKNKIFFKKHAIKRMLERDIFLKDINECFKQFEIIEEYYYKNSLTLFLILYKTKDKKPLHVLIALNDDKLWIITCYFPDKNLWDNSFRKRRKK